MSNWIVPYNKLDDQQKDFVDNVDFNQKNVWIKGFPGSGKSVLLAHTIAKIKRESPSASMDLVVFTRSLIAMFKAAFQEMRINVHIETYFEFRKSSQRYDYILSDEVQDLTPSILREMNSRAKHVIVGGDENQSIFDSDPLSGERTVSSSEIDSLLNSRDFSLNMIHRLSSAIIDVVQKFLPRMNIFAAKRDMTKISTDVRICEGNNSSEEAKYIMREAQKAINVGETSAVLIPSTKAILQFVKTVLINEGKEPWNTQLNRWGKPDYNLMNEHLSTNGISLQLVGNGYGTFAENSRKITIMTYHSSKGLDFDNVFLPGLNNSLFINSDETLSKTLFMVAMTRSRNNLYLTYYGYASPYLSNFMRDCNKINIHDALAEIRKTAGSGIFGGI
jgi:superfamily I DNA/RNA helicase